jgi:hypothetical protein
MVELGKALSLGGEVLGEQVAQWVSIRG